MAIKVVALDIYGTVLSSTDYDNELPPRKGLEAFLDKCDVKGIKVVTASDSDFTNLKIDLKESGIDIERFDDFFCLNQFPYKDFSLIVDSYKIQPQELFVIGDDDKEYDALKPGQLFHGPDGVQRRKPL